MILALHGYTILSQKSDKAYSRHSRHLLLQNPVVVQPQIQFPPLPAPCAHLSSQARSADARFLARRRIRPRVGNRDEPLDKCSRRGVLRRLPRDRNGVARCPHRATERVVTPPLDATFNPELPSRPGGRTGRRAIRTIVVGRVAHFGGRPRRRTIRVVIVGRIAHCS